VNECDIARLKPVYQTYQEWLAVITLPTVLNTLSDAKLVAHVDRAIVERI